MARPTELTDLVQQRICEAIRAGNYYEAAVGRGGIDYSTFTRWMKRGEREPGIYRTFRNAILAAEADAEVRVVAQWQQQIPDNWQAARDFLARRFPERWANREKIDVGGSGKEIVFRVTYGDSPERAAGVDSSAAPTASETGSLPSEQG